MKKITPLMCILLCFSFGFAQQDLMGETWQLHYIEINGTTFNVAPTQGINHAGITFFESPANFYQFSASAGDINNVFNAGGSLTFGTGTFTADFPSITLGNCSHACTLESQYLVTVMLGNGSNPPPRTYNYEIIDQGNNEKVLIIDTPEGNRAVHGNFTLSVEKFSKKSIAIYPNPVKKKLHFDFKGFSPEKINVLSIVGTSVFETKISNQQSTLDVSFLTPGIYVMRTSFKDGDTIVSKIIKE